MSAKSEAWGELSLRDGRVSVKLKRSTDHSPADRFREARAAFSAIIEEELAA